MVEQEYEKNFPLEKLLTISASDYCKIKSKDLSDYIAIGIRDISFTYDATSTICTKITGIPKDTEVVVAYRDDYHLGGYGTALIPKK